jgi:mRNA-degrading endonuclease toxin of MazEF toxin-antitoxin module
MTSGDIYLTDFPFGGSKGSKPRPALLLTGPVGPVPELLAAYISSTLPPILLPTDYLIDPSNPAQSSANMKTVSVIRRHKLATLHRRRFYRLVGHLSPLDTSEVEARLRLLLGI